MAIKYEVVIGIENHIQLKTVSKMFSPGPVSYGADPNSQVHPLDIALPGVLPTVNQKGVKYAIMLCHALHMEIAPLLMFDRKNYYYSDLSKGFQITQFFHPIGVNGYLDISPHSEAPVKIKVDKIQIEEDTAKQIYQGNVAQLDFNRAGIGLLEVVSAPVMSDAETVLAYVKQLRDIVIFLGISDGKMAEGSFRCDVNISLRPCGTTKMLNKVEIKNLNSFANIKKAISYEIKRQTSVLASGSTVYSETRRFDEGSNTTVSMRRKETTGDYRFLAEPNIQPIVLKQDWIAYIKDHMPALPAEIRQKLLIDFQLPPAKVEILLRHFELCSLFQESLLTSSHALMIINFITGDILAFLNNHQLTLKKTRLVPTMLAELVNRLQQDEFSSKHAKLILQELLVNGGNVNAAIKKLQIVYLNDPALLKPIIVKIIADNKLFIDKNIGHTDRIQKFVMGQTMKATKGNCSPTLTSKLAAAALQKLAS